MDVYLDYAATAPLRPEIRALLHQCYTQEWGNASSLHRQGHTARMHLENARERIALLLGARVEEIIFTSGATEANNLAIMGWMRLQPAGSHLILSSIEHPSVWEAAEQLSHQGYFIDQAPVDQHGLVNTEQLLQMVRPHTRMVSLMAVNNEVGTVQPVSQLAALSKNWKLHVDAVQSGLLGWPDLSGIDMLSLSAHKLGGPVGSGCLYLKQGLHLNPLLFGGAQEDHRRAGTNNVVAALALAQAMELSASQQAPELRRITEIRDTLENSLSQISGATRLGKQRSPHISSWFFEDVLAEPLLVRLDLEGVSASSGSACSSHSLQPSRVVSAMGYQPEQARGLVRFSFGHASTIAEVESVAQNMSRWVEQTRKSRKRGGHSLV